MPKNKRQVRSALLRKGFRIEDGDHWFLWYWTLDGKQSTAKTKISYGSKKDISDTLLSEMAKQLHLRSAEFSAFIECSLSRKDYEELLKERGILT